MSKRKKGGGLTTRETRIVHDIVEIIKARLTSLHTYERDTIDEEVAKFIEEYR